MDKKVKKLKTAIQLIDYFVYQQFSHDHDRLYHARILAGVMLAFIVIVTSTMIYLPFSSLDLVGMSSGGSICLIVTACFATLLVNLKRTGDFLLCANVTICLTFFFLVLAVWVSSGPFESPVIWLLYIPPVMAFLLTGNRSVGIWAVVVALTILGLFVLGFSGIEFIETDKDLKHQRETLVLVYSVGYLALIGFIVIYDLSNKQLVKERDIEHEKYVFLANHDQLTKLANRARFETELTNKITFHGRRRQGPLIALMYLDLNGFKPINDRYGHHIGDCVLKEIALRLCSSVRDSDLVARQGGDEFTLLFDNLNDIESIETIAEKISSRVEAVIESPVGPLKVTASIGIALYPKHTTDIQKLQIYADAAMYAAKEQQCGWLVFNDRYRPIH